VFFLLEILVGVMVILGIGATMLQFSNTLWHNYQVYKTHVKLKNLKTALEEFYKDNAMAVNSHLLPDENVSTSKGSVVSGVIPLPDGRELKSYLGEKPISIENTSLKGLLYFRSPKEIVDWNEAPFRIYVTPLQEDSEGRFAYRDIYLINAKGRTAQIASYPECSPTGSGYYKCTFHCAPDEECIKIDGYKITYSLYDQTYKALAKTASRIQTYAQQLYAQDPQKDILRYYLSHESSNNKNDLTCSPGEVDCYYSHLSEIRNSSLYNQVGEFVERFNGYEVNWSEPSGSRLAYASSIPFITLKETPFHSRLYYDNSSNLVRTPETVPNYAGYTMLLFTPIDDSHGIKYYLGQ